MFKTLVSLALCATMGAFGGTMEEETLISQFKNATSVVVTINNEQVNAELESVVKNFEDMAEDAYFSPAFGVSIDNLTRADKKTGVWVEFNFDGTHEFAGMPYEKLLINIQPNFYGFNIIRFNNNKYDGRCYYLNLAKTSDDFYNYLISLKK